MTDSPHAIAPAWAITAGSIPPHCSWRDEPRADDRRMRGSFTASSWRLASAVSVPGRRRQGTVDRVRHRRLHDLGRTDPHADLHPDHRGIGRAVGAHVVPPFFTRQAILVSGCAADNGATRSCCSTCAAVSLSTFATGTDGEAAVVEAGGISSGATARSAENPSARGAARCRAGGRTTAHAARHADGRS